ncbi:MAG: DUF6891 domain-containing protein [Giesbergeria sp.]
MIDKVKLNVAFSLMRKAGLVARQNFSCCGSCAASELTTDIVAMPTKKRAKVKGVCFYHWQDAKRHMSGDDLMLRYGPVASKEHGQIGLDAVQVGRLVTSCLTQAGLAWEWNGNVSQCILVRA